MGWFSWCRRGAGAGRNVLNTVFARIGDIAVLKNGYIVTIDRKRFVRRTVKNLIGLGGTDGFQRVLACINNYFGLMDYLYLALGGIELPR